MIPEPNYIKIDRKYAPMLHSLSITEKGILFDRILEYHIPCEEMNDIDDGVISGIFGLLTLDFE